jgi:GINS complex subunit 1
LAHTHRLTTRYREQYVDLNLGASLLPPKETYIQVRVLRACGNVLTENGTIALLENSQHYVRRTDVETLISQGFLQHIA